MSDSTTFDRYLARYPSTAVAAYAVFVIAFLVTAWIAVADIFEQRAVLADSVDILHRLEARQEAAGGAGGAADAIPRGSPFLGGDTITVAGATLLQRVASAITRFGGTVQSSQVDLRGPQAKDGFVTLVVSCEIEQSNLQNLLYDIEAGMPFLFVDQLVVQGPQTSVMAGGSRMRVLLAVSGQWKDTR